MDVMKAIQRLIEERDRIDQEIARLRSQAGGPAPEVRSPPRGRRRMSPEERQAVSVRMRRYWDSKRGVPGGE